MPTLTDAERSRNYRAKYRTYPGYKTAKDAVNRLPHNVCKRAYSNIIRRTSGLDPHAMQSFGLPVGFTRDEFLAWTMDSIAFWRLYHQWTQHNYERAFAPSIDRISDFLGYTPDNVQWIVWSENNNKYRPRHKLPGVKSARRVAQVITQVKNQVTADFDRLLEVCHARTLVA